MGLKDLLGKWEAAWKLLVPFVAFVVAILGQWLASPPTLWREAGDQPAFVFFFVTVAVAWVAGRVVAGTQPSPKLTFAVFVPLAFVAIVAYFVLRSNLSCPFYDDRMSIGWTYLPAATEHVARNPGQSCGLLIADFIGDTDQIWSRSQILRSWLCVLAVYVIAVTSVSVTVVRLMDHLRSD